MKQLLFSLSLFLLVLPCQGQEKLGLTDAIQTALKNSYDIRLAKDNLEIAGINNNIGVAGALPVVTANVNDNETVTSINQKFPDPSRNISRSGVSSNNLTANVNAGILLFNGFRVKATKQRLEQLEAQNREQLNAQIQNTIAAVSSQYYEVVRQQYLLQAVNRSLEVAQQRLDILRNRKDVGLSNNADIFQAELDLNALKQQAQTQVLVIDQAKTNLLNLIFVRPDSNVVIQDTIVVDPNINLKEIRALALKNPSLLVAEQQIKVNELIEREVSALRIPTLRATTGFNLNNTTSAAGFILQNQSFGPFLGVNLAIPIYNGSINKRQQKVAEVNTRIAKTQRDNFLLDLETGAIRTYQSYANTLGQLTTAKENFELAKQLLDLVLMRFQLGQSTIVDVRIAQQSFENEAYRLVNLAYATKLAEIELNRLANRLTP